MNTSVILESLSALNTMHEDTFNMNKDGIDKLKNFLDGDIMDDDVEVVDVEAKTEEEAEESHFGDFILECPVCKLLMFKKKDSVEIEDDFANIGEPCPQCQTSDGFKIVGKVAPLEEVTVDIEKKEKLEGCSKLKEGVAPEIDKYQTWVDYDMKTYGKISKTTMDAIKQAGYSVIEDVDGEWEVIGHTADHDDYEIEEGLFDRKPQVRIQPFIAWDTLDGKVRGGKIVATPVEGRKGVYNWYVDVDGRPSDKRKYQEKELTSRTDLIPEMLVKKTAEELNPELKDIHLFDMKFVDRNGEVKPRVKEEYAKKLTAKYTKSGSKEYKELIKMDEGLNNIDIETDDEFIHVKSEEKECCDDEMIEEISEKDIDEIEDKEAEGEDEDFDEVDVDEIDEESFDEVTESLLKKVYSNVKSYKTTDGSMDKNNIFLEGVVTFTSGAEKKTHFKLTPISECLNGKCRVICENRAISEKEHIFEALAKICGKKVILESAKFSFNAKGEGNAEQLVEGVIPRNRICK